MTTLIIGGGMSGLTYGILSARSGIDTVLCERNARVGKKLSATGNGRCNIGNANINKACFNGSNIVNAVISKVTVDKYLQFLQSCGIYTFCDDFGRIYPLSESANNVIDCLRYAYSRSGGTTVCNCEVRNVKRLKDGFNAEIDGAVKHFDKVVLACGSESSADKLHIDGLVSEQWFTKRVPSLVPVTVKNMDKTLNGLRVKAQVSLICSGKARATEHGEVQFKQDGLSGICVFNLSAIVARDIVAGHVNDYTFTIDLFPTLSEAQLTAILQQREDYESDKKFYGLLHNTLANYVVRTALNSGKQCTAKTLATAAKHLTFKFAALQDFSKSQVTAGGIEERYVDLATLTLPNGVIALGELLNVDGICGGYNLYFAAASALYLFVD